VLLHLFHIELAYIIVAGGGAGSLRPLRRARRLGNVKALRHRHLVFDVL
jgi:hypothetical protein